MKDAELLRCLKEGDPETQRRFWADKSVEVHKIAIHVLGEGIDAEEIATGALVDFLFEYVQRIEHPSAVKSYLRLMVVRRSLRFKQRKDRPVGRLEDALDDNQRSADDVVGDAALLRKLEECLAVLTPKARETIRLRFHGELTNERIGALVGGSKQYIGRLLKKSFESLRLCLEGARG